ncbi:hypothetical protein V6N13_008316 [Hibiscus sabdariffa]
MKPKSLVSPVSHTAVNSFSVLVHTACHTTGAGHARSRYLNCKEGDAEGRASDWSEVITSHMDSSMCSSTLEPEMWIIQGTLAWRTSPVRTEDGPAAPRKRIEEAYDSFMHAPLGSGDIA